VLAVLPTGCAKTTLASGAALYWAQFKPDARVPIGAAASKQARIVYEQAAGFVQPLARAGGAVHGPARLS
jgi:predicted amidophosphoribosyltransferase